jgi:plasmid stabilization system protein ParE
VRILRRSKSIDDLTEAYAYLSERSPSAADRLLDDVEAVADLLATSPRFARPRDELRPAEMRVDLPAVEQFEVIQVPFNLSTYGAAPSTSRLPSYFRAARKLSCQPPGWRKNLGRGLTSDCHPPRPPRHPAVATWLAASGTVWRCAQARRTVQAICRRYPGLARSAPPQPDLSPPQVSSPLPPALFGLRDFLGEHHPDTYLAAHAAFAGPSYRSHDHKNRPNNC